MLGLKPLLLDVTKHLPFGGKAVCQLTDCEEFLLIDGIIESSSWEIRVEKTLFR